MDEIYSKIAAKFEKKDLRTFARIINLIEKGKLDPFEMRDYVNRFMVQKFLLPSDLKLCPVCNGKMMIMPVNTGDRDQVGGDLKSQWWCRNCDEAEYSELSVENEMRMRTL